MSVLMEGVGVEGTLQGGAETALQRNQLSPQRAGSVSWLKQK